MKSNVFPSKISFIPRSGLKDSINFGWSSSPFGKCLILVQSDVLVGLAFKDNFTNDLDKKTIELDMKNRWAKTKNYFKPANTKNLATDIFVKALPTKISFSGSHLQNKVWEALLDIPIGETITYKDIAHAAGYPKAIRAVATAIGQNPIAWIIPCHRVLRKSGSLGGYRWGLEIKRMMLSHEGES